MTIGMIGLGRMGGNMVRRLLRGGHRCVVHDLNPDSVSALVHEGAIGAASFDELPAKLEPPRAVWIMVPAGDATEQTVHTLAERLERGDTIIDGGNSYFKDDVRRASELRRLGIHYLDVGTSGGIWGLAEGYSLMVGGPNEAVDRLRPVFETLAPAKDQGWGHVGPAGSGHFTKMVHNGIEYGMMQAYAEGFEIMKAKTEFGLDLYQIAETWRVGSVVRSWLLDLAARALADDPDLAHIKGFVADSGEGRWTVAEAIDLDVSAPVITLALQNRLRSRNPGPFGDKLLAALRNQFGGHAVQKE